MTEEATAAQEKAEQAALERRANKLFSGRVDFLLSAPQLKFLPEPTVPEIAFAGRSNVGKSSLYNFLTRATSSKHDPWARVTNKARVMNNAGYKNFGNKFWGLEINIGHILMI